jgi:hypothetical protein
MQMTKNEDLLTNDGNDKNEDIDSLELDEDL